MISIKDIKGFNNRDYKFVANFHYGDYKFVAKKRGMKFYTSMYTVAEAGGALPKSTSLMFIAVTTDRLQKSHNKESSGDLSYLESAIIDDTDVPELYPFNDYSTIHVKGIGWILILRPPFSTENAVKFIDLLKKKGYVVNNDAYKQLKSTAIQDKLQNNRD